MVVGLFFVYSRLITMTITNLQGQTLCEALAENYRRTLPKNGRGVLWTMETFSQWLRLRYPEVRLVEGQPWMGIRKGGAHQSYTFVCEDHGEYETIAGDVLRQTGSHKGSHCPGCSAARSKAQQYKITAAFVGKTTQDGHLILEHIGYKATPSKREIGNTGDALYRYRCGVCGNEEATGLGHHLKRPGHITHCGCLSVRDSRLTFSQNVKKAEAPCFIYVFSTIANTGIKVGISNNIKRRASENYDEQLFVSQSLPRAVCWSVEQVIHHRLRTLGLQYDLEDVPAFQAGEECGGSEVFYSFDLAWVITQINELIAEADAIGWEALIDRYIPIAQQTHRQLFYWDGERMCQSKGEGYVGQRRYRSVFDIPTTSN